MKLIIVAFHLQLNKFLFKFLAVFVIQQQKKVEMLIVNLKFSGIIKAIFISSNIKCARVLIDM